jgi:cytochrome c
VRHSFSHLGVEKLMAAALGGAFMVVMGMAASGADANKGHDLFEKRCTGCHSLDQVKVGPRLRGVFGRVNARDDQFTYSDAMKKAHLTWDEATLDKWLTDPDSLIPDTDMSFRLNNPVERADIIAYLKSIPAK